LHSRAPFIPAALILFSLIAATPARAWTYGDTLTTIWRPLPNLPAFARPGDTFTVWANAGAGVLGWNASLRFGALTVPLTPAGGGYQVNKGRWELGFAVPANTPEELYDLVLTSAGTLPDTARHAVKVIPQYRTDYYFAQISDTHLPTHALSSGGVIDTSDSTAMADFNAVIADLNVIHPEFVIHTGDLVNEGELEEYLGMYEMGRAQQMLSRLFSPVFVSSGNHDIGGWKATAPPDGTARKNWWRQFGWNFLANPPAGDPYHSQDFSFDYGLLHVIGLEAYINNGSYDSYMTNIWGAQSMTPEQMNWLAADVATVPAGHSKLAFFHYDFGGTLGNGSPAANFSQFNNPAALGLDGVIWGHNHGVAEGNRTARPFNLGLQAIIDGRRTFRIFRVSNGVMSPGPMHHSGGSSSTPTDSLTVTWSGANDGTRSGLTATVLNRFGEAWEHARLLFVLVDHDSSFAASGGTLVETLRQGGRANVYVDCTLPAGGTTVVSVLPAGPLAVGETATSGLRMEPPMPSPYRPDGGALMLRYALPRPGRVRITIIDAAGRRVARLFEGEQDAGGHAQTWSGRSEDGNALRAGIYLVRLQTELGERTRKFSLMR
jgi:calcineurin-like phosphoesterase family protein/flagellar hook capping protein FlgD